jgi:type I restriction enzyme M protein
MQQPIINHHGISLQTSEQIEALVRQLKPVLGSMYETVRAQFILLQQYDNQQQASNTTIDLNSLDDESTLSKKALEAYSAWQTSVRTSFSDPQIAFCLQTTYMQFLRIFFVRACEDYGLIPPHLNSHETFICDKQLQTELHANIKYSFTQIFKKIYPRARLDYSSPLHYEHYDWFIPSEHSILRLYSLLSNYNFQGLNVDILGRIYNEGFIENKHRSEKGQFYTLPHLVNYMLDSLGIPVYRDDDYRKACGFLEKMVGDLSCGSGSFLVAAAARKRAILQHLVAIHEISLEHALKIVNGTFLGFDLNPFACLLAEMNLLIQCLPFLLDEQSQLCRSVNDFHIYCADALEQSITERAIDYLVGNPPYVSAAESFDNLVYRNKVSSSGIYQLLHQRWDLFVPFFERNLQLLRQGTGRLGLIVSNGIETEGYAELLRKALSSQYRLLQIDFFPKLRLFHDAAVESTIVLIENRPPDVHHKVIRRKHVRTDCMHFETLHPVLQLDSNDQIFRWRYDPALDKSLAEGTIPLCAIVYIGTGLEVQSNEDFDPVTDGKRQKRFTLYDVFLPPSAGITRPVEYTNDGVLGDDVGNYYLRRKRYVAYEKYRPHMRGPRHIALFRTAEKLLLGETSGGYYDCEGLFANHSVQVVVSWKALEQAGAIQERGIQRVYRKSHKISGISEDLPPIAELFDLRYLLAIINSRFMRLYIASNMHEGTRKGRIYPDVWKRLPIKVASVERQRHIAMLVDKVQAEYQQVAVAQGTEDQRLHTTINGLLLEIEALVEATYNEPADAVLIETIRAKMDPALLFGF